MDDDETQTIPSPRVYFSDPFTIAVTVLVICSATLSVIGSSAIVFKIIRDRAKNRSTTTYDRIIFCLSSGDIFASVYYTLFGFLGFIASSASCQAWGVLWQLSVWAVWAVWYNCILSFYFLVTVLSQVRRKDYVRKCEPWLHFSGLYFPITAILGYTQGWFGVMDLGTGCDVLNPVFFMVTLIPVASTFLLMIINYSVIYTVLRKSLGSSNEFISSENVAGPTSLQRRLKSEATTMMLLYVGCFFITWSPGFVCFFSHFLGGTVGKMLYPFALILTVILTPLQGFFNVFIYLRPAYTRFRAANPDKSMYFVSYQALLNPKIPQLNDSGDPSTYNAVAERDVGISGIDFQSSFYCNEDAEEDDDSSDSSA